MGSRFQYLALGNQKDIRLVFVNQISSSGRMHCTMIPVDRFNLPSAEPGFTAISYRWGDERVKGELEMRNVYAEGEVHIAEDYCVKELPQSTLDMLLELHETGRIRGKWFWIDYLSLDQSNVSEKSAQVKRMGTVFELAVEVLVYTGPAVPSTQLAMTFWEALERTFEAFPRRGQDGELILYSHEELLGHTFTTWASPEWKALQEHLTRPYFRRLWVIQEVVLAQNAIYLWGSYALSALEIALFVDWDLRSNLSMLLYQHDSSCWFSVKMITEVVFLRMYRTVENRDWIGVLSLVVWSCDGAYTTDPRDRIYGVLGLLYGDDICIVPNYSPENTVYDLYTDATKRSLATATSFDIMYGAGIGWEQNYVGLPSWVPDFTTTFSHRPGQHLRAGIGGSDESVKPLTPHPVSGAVVQVEDDPYTEWYLSTAIEMVKTVHPAPWSDAFFNSFWRTLTFNSIASAETELGQDSPVEYGITFANLDVVRASGIRAETVVNAASNVQRERFLTTAMDSGSKHTVCITGSGMVVLAPRLTETADVVAVCLGARAPFVLRATNFEKDGKKVYRFVGTGYAHELNDGIHIAASKTALGSIILR
ncbi:hypothetical protein LTR10_007943 [Elasticomyces elasticus]|nr:hypothetical protein LTR10_007943 [Elasticomyces elasticus]KAK4970942.1 hypothetical protein LTR42_007919 [Elasticomyces elasticus]